MEEGLPKPEWRLMNLRFGMFYVVEDGRKLRDDVANAKSSTPLYEIIIIIITVINTVINTVIITVIITVINIFIA